MITIDNKTYRNIQEQVEKNKQDIAAWSSVELTLNNFGIKVLGRVDYVSDIPEATYEYGDAYLVGLNEPFNIYIYTRTTDDVGMFINIGPLNIVGQQGPEGPQGPAGKDGYAPVIRYGNGLPVVEPTDKKGYIYIDQQTSRLYTFDNSWNFVINMQGPKGDTGATGLQGTTGTTLSIVGKLSSPSLLPTNFSSGTIPKNSAYLVDVQGVNRLYIILGDQKDYSTWYWQDVGDFNMGSVIYKDSVFQTAVNVTDSYTTNTGALTTDTAVSSLGSHLLGMINDKVSGEELEQAILAKADQSQITEINQQLAKTLKVPTSAPEKTKLVGIDTSNSETLIDADTYLPETFNSEQTLKNTGGTTPIRLESNSGDCWLRFWGTNGQIGELGGYGKDNMPLWWDTKKIYKICLDQSEFTTRTAHNSMKLGNMIINFGTIESYSSGPGLATYNLTFKTAFTTSKYWILAVPDGDITDSPSAYDYTGMVKTSNRTPTGCTLSVNYVADNKCGVSYIAIGK